MADDRTPAAENGKTDGRARGRTGIASLASDDFSVVQSIGGARGVVESVLPGLVFLVVFLISRNLTLTIEVSLALCAIEVVARLVQRQTVAGALSGAVMVLICLFAAWRSNDARNYYLPSLIINAVWALALGVSLAVRCPGIGLVVEFVASTPTENFGAWYHSWHDDRALCRAYVRATWLWIALFVVRDAVQVPLWLAGNVTWLGTMTLVLGVPLFALVCWISYLIIGTPRHEHGLAAVAAEDDGNGAGPQSGGESKKTEENHNGR